MSIEPDGILTDPGEQAIIVGQGLDGGMGNGGAGSQEDDTELIDGDVAVPGFVVKRQSGGGLIERAHFEVEVAPAVAKARQFMKGAHRGSARNQTGPKPTLCWVAHPGQEGI